MRILKYIMFISILSGLFFIVWKRSEQKGFRRWWSSFRRAVFLAAILTGLINDPIKAFEPPESNNGVYQERIRDQEYALWENDKKVVMAKGGGSGNISPSPGLIGQPGPSTFPTPLGPKPRPKTPTTPSQAYRAVPKVVGQPGGPGGAGGGNGNGNGGGKAEFDEQCPVSKNEQDSKKDQTDPPSDIFSQKPKDNDQCAIDEKKENQEQKEDKKKKRNQHLNREIEVNGENFEFERSQIEKKAPSHGTDFGLEPDYGPDGEIIRNRKTAKPRAKQNKENYEKFTDNLSEFVKDPQSERIDPQYHKGRENEQDATGFLNRRDRRFVIFNRHTKKYITGWVMNDLQYQEFIDNNNII